MKKILTLGCLIVALNGCSKLDQDSEEFRNEKANNASSMAWRIIRDKTKILSNSVVNTAHKENSESEYAERFDADGYEDVYSKACFSLFKITTSDLKKSSSGGIRSRVVYELENEDDVKFDAFKACVKDKYKSVPVFGSDLRLFLSEPVLIKYRDNQLIRVKLNQIKSDEKLTLEEVVSMYELLEKVNITERSKSNENLLKNF